MRYLAGFVICLYCLTASSSDTVKVEDAKDPRYLKYLDSLEAYQIGYSVAKNIAEAVRDVRGNNSLDAYFLSMYMDRDAQSEGYFYDFNERADVEIGHVNNDLRGIKRDSIIPWQYIEAQYKRLDALKVKPIGVIQGAELPYVYVYGKPSATVIIKKTKRYTVIDPAIKFLKRDDGKTKVSYILKYYYIKEGFDHERIDSVEKLDPITYKHLFY